MNYLLKCNILPLRLPSPSFVSSSTPKALPSLLLPITSTQLCRRLLTIRWLAKLRVQTPFRGAAETIIPVVAVVDALITVAVVDVAMDVVVMDIPII